MFISSYFNNYSIDLKNKKIKNKLSPRWDPNWQPPGCEATEHLRNRMRKENCRNAFKNGLYIVMSPCCPKWIDDLKTNNSDE